MQTKSNQTNKELLIKIEQLESKISELEKFKFQSNIWLENSPVCTKIIDLDFNLQFMSKYGVNALKIVDISDFYGKPFPLHFHPDSFKSIMFENLKKAKETGETIIQEAPIVDTEGNTLWYHSTIVPVNNENGQLDYFMVFSTEITAGKLAEDSLKKQNQEYEILNKELIHTNKDLVFAKIKAEENQKLYEDLVQSSHNLIWKCDLEGRFTFLNSAWENTHNYKVEEMLGRPFSDFQHKEVFERDIIEFTKHLEGGFVKGYETTHLRKDGSEIHLIFNALPLFNSLGKIIGTQGTAFDISKLKQTEQEIINAKEKAEKSDERFELAMSAAKDGLFDWNLETNEIYYSPRWKGMLGYKDNELPNDFSVWEKLTKPEDVEASWKMQQELINKRRDHFEIEFKMMHKDGHWVDILSRADAVFDDKGEAIRIIGTHLDITESKLKEQLILKNKNRLEYALRSIETGAWELDLKTLESWRSSKHDQIFGYEKPLKKWTLEMFLEHIIPEDRKEVNEKFQQAFLAKSDWNFECRIQQKGGNIRWIYANGVHELDINNNETLKMFGVVKDITDKKLVEEKILVAEKNLKNTFDISPSIICKANLNTGYFIEVNKAVTRILGYSFEEFTSTPFIDLIHPDDQQKSNDEKEEQLEGKDVTFFENRYLCKDGSYKWIAWHGTKADLNGIVTAIGSDINERKSAEQIHNESEVKYRTMIEASNDMIWTLDSKGNFTFMNKQTEKATGYCFNDFIGKSFEPLVMPEELPFLKEVLEKTMSGESVTYEMKLKTVFNTVLILSVNTAPIFSGDKISGMFSFARDISRRKEIEQELINSEAKQSEMISNISDVISIMNTQEIITYKSPNITNLFGWNPEELIGNSGYAKVHSDDKVYVQNEFYKLIKNKQSQLAIEFRYECKDGNYKVVHCTASNLITNPHIKGILLNYHDISQQKEIELSLKESEKRFKALHNASFGGIAIHDMGIIKDCNQGLSNITGYSIEELIGMDGLLCIAEDSKKIVKQNIISFYEKAYEVVGLRKNGEEFPLRLEAKVIPYEGKKMRVVEFRDITEQKKVENNIKKLSTAIKQSPLIILITDTKGILEYVNPVFTEITGYTSYEALGKESNILKSGEQDFAFYKELWETIESGKVWKGQFHNKKKNGELFWEAASISAILDNSGNIINYIKVGEDITQQKITEEELKIALEKALESDRLKSAFLANMSHEIRTPMNGILGFVELLNDPNLSKSQIGEYSSIINKSGDRLLNTINDIVDISKIEAGEMTITKTEISINTEVEELYSFFLPEAKRKGLSLCIEPSLPSKPLMVLTDSNKLHGILTNLIKNAIKYTKNGEVTFGYSLKKENIEFYVKDTGIGIPKNRLKAIFNRFEQADISDKMVFEGSGLGLAISKAYVEMLGGEIFVDSDEGKGSNFKFTIPYIRKIEKEVKDLVESSETNNKKIKMLNLLIVEDDEVNSELLKYTLKGMFKKVIFVDNGKDAVQICKDNVELDLVLMDIKLPIMNGYDATKEIRRFNKDLLIIAQTAYALHGDKEKAIEAGCDDYISKPIDKELLLEIINKLIN